MNLSPFATWTRHLSDLTCHLQEQSLHKERKHHWPREVLLHSHPFLCGNKIEADGHFQTKDPIEREVPPGVLVNHHPRGWIDADSMKLWIQKVWSSRPGGLLKNKKLACVGIILSSPWRPAETSAPPDQHRYRSDTQWIN